MFVGEGNHRHRVHCECVHIATSSSPCRPSYPMASMATVHSAPNLFSQPRSNKSTGHPHTHSHANHTNFPSAKDASCPSLIVYRPTFQSTSRWRWAKTLIWCATECACVYIDGHSVTGMSCIIGRIEDATHETMERFDRGQQYHPRRVSSVPSECVSRAHTWLAATSNLIRTTVTRKS